MKIRIQKLLSLFAGYAGLGTILCWVTNSSGQNLFAEVSDNGIYEVSGGSVNTTPISDVGTGGLAFDSSGDLYFVNNSYTLSEYSSGGIQSTLGLPLLPYTFTRGFTIAGVDNQDNLWGLSGNNLYQVPLSYDAPIFLAAEAMGPAMAMNSSGQVFAEYITGEAGVPNEIYQVTSIPTVLTEAYNTFEVSLAAMTFDNAGDLFELNNFGSIYEVTPGGQDNLILSFLNDSLGATCMTCDSIGDLYLGRSDGNIVEINTNGMESTIATLSGPVDGLAFQPAPEPSAFGLFGIGASLLLLYRSRRG